MNSFALTPLNRSSQHYKPVYPSYSGSSYLNDNGQLVIHVKGNISEMENNVRKVAGTTNNVIYEQSEYSMNDLYTIY